MTIIEKVHELQQLIKEEYGYEANIDIKVFSEKYNGFQASKEGLNKLSYDLACQLRPEEIFIYVNRTYDSTNWVNLSTRHFEFAGFYQEPVLETPDVEVQAV